MEFKGTKGKWESKKNSSYFDVETEFKKGSTILCVGVSLFNVDEDGNISSISLSKESEANTKLIAAAPEMFEMLKEFIEDFDNGLIEDYQIPRDRFEKLLTKITE